MIESKRLQDVLLLWLEYEKSRPDFEIVALEKKMDIKLGELAITLKMDRVDAVGPEQYLIIDYKTGEGQIQAWEPPRMDEPQLPLYAVFMSPAPMGIAFARLKKNKMGLERVGGDAQWQALLQAFREDLYTLSEEVLAGYGATQPKYAHKTCANCDLEPGCRFHTGGVYER
jgi:RecB family exonuclease